MHVNRQMVFALTIVAVTVASPSSDERFCGKNCDRSLCSRVRCRTIQEDECKGKIRQGGGFCNCCQNCIIPLLKGSDCDPNPGYGLPEPVPYCEDGLTCDCTTRRCVPCGKCAFPFQ